MCLLLKPESAPDYFVYSNILAKLDHCADILLSPRILWQIVVWHLSADGIIGLNMYLSARYIYLFVTKYLR